MITRRSLLVASGAGLATAALPLAFARPLRAQTPPLTGLPASAPQSIARVGLHVQDAERVAEWYIRVVGLIRLDPGAATLTLGAPGLAGADPVPLLELYQDSALRLAPPREAGLYHTAFLLPSREALAHWVMHASRGRFPVTGAADHLVSEAVYLDDPEGNGVEIYADRAPSTWRWRDGQVEMGSEPFDAEGLVGVLGMMPPQWNGAPAGTLIGHVHLRVGDAERASGFWQSEMGFDLVRGRSGAAFLSTGGYHHHIAANQWESAGAGPRPEGLTGLAHVTLAQRGGSAAGELRDPWGTLIRRETV